MGPNHLVCQFQVGSQTWRPSPLSKESGLGFQVPKVGGRKLFSLSSVEGLQTGTPQAGSSGLPIPSRESSLVALSKESGLPSS